MKIGYDLKIEQSQKMVMNHELLQSIEILQFSNQELDAYLKEQMLENPFLEYDSSSISEDLISTDSIKERYYEEESKRYSDDAPNPEEYTANRTTLWDKLKDQLQLCKLDEVSMKVGLYLIYEIDENGYLNTDIDFISQYFDVDVDRIEDIIYLIQGFDPVGVGARNLSECLSIQICDKGLLKPEMSVLLDCHLEDMAQNNIAKINKETGISKEIIEETIAIIKTLEPKPGRAYYTLNDSRYIVPNMEVDLTDGKLNLVANQGSLPKVTISTYYEELSSEASKDMVLREYITDRINKANFIVRAMEQRKATILNVTKEIVNFQTEYFTRGEKYLKPLTLKAVAENLGVHESTISRAIHGKFMATPYGVLPYKFFFNSGISSSSGDGLSSRSIKYLIKEIIDNEDAKKPYSDQYIMEKLQEKDIDISRRTVAKYREGMGIESSSKRKRY